ncbi:MAG: hypothetical protein IJS46_00715 [Kiritimatiellae bacterium]|nr:hypothetical protein [Kiritimatiellia bacterium]
MSTSFTLAATAAACMALFGASRADVFAFRFSWWRLALAGNLAAVSAYAAARCPALPPLGAALSAAEKARTLALGTIPALLPLAAVAVPERGLCVLAVCALAHRAASFSGVMAIAYAAICTRFSPEPGAFATALCLFAAVSAFCPRLPGFFSPYGSSHQRRNFKSLPET